MCRKKSCQYNWEVQWNQIDLNTMLFYKVKCTNNSNTMHFYVFWQKRKKTTNKIVLLFEKNLRMNRVWTLNSVYKSRTKLSIYWNGIMFNKCMVGNWYICLTILEKGIRTVWRETMNSSENLAIKDKRHATKKCKLPRHVSWTIYLSSPLSCTTIFLVVLPLCDPRASSWNCNVKIKLPFSTVSRSFKRNV